jgi:hypothetical protein
MHLVEKIRESPAFVQPEEQTDNWDDDFEEEISLTKIQGVLILGLPRELCSHSMTSSGKARLRG